MSTWSYGLVPMSFAKTVSGKKTAEERLCVGKFTRFRVGDEIAIRADYYEKHGERCQSGRTPQVW